MKCLITGAGGMLGSDLAGKFAKSFKIIGLGRKPKPPHLNIPYLVCDLNDEAAVGKIFEKEKPDVVFHAAAMTRVDDCEFERERAVRDNAEATRGMVEACNKVKAFLIFFSTDYVFDGEKKDAYCEDDACNPLNVYGETKLLAEEAIRRDAESYVIFRTSWLYGLHGRSFPRTILNLAKAGSPLKIVSDQIGRPTYTKDIACALYELFDKNGQTSKKLNRQIFHLANQGTASWAEFAESILRAASSGEARIERISSDQRPQGAKRPKNSVLSLEKTERILGIKMRPWQEAVKDFIQEFNASEKV